MAGFAHIRQAHRQLMQLLSAQECMGSGVATDVSLVERDYGLARASLDFAVIEQRTVEG